MNYSKLEELRDLWLPIETAPTNIGAKIIGWCDGEAVSLDYQRPCTIGINNQIEIAGCWIQVSDSGRASTFSPTHWLPPIPGPRLI